MMFFTGWSRFVSKRRSRLVTMPTTRLPSSTGRPGDAVLARELDALRARSWSGAIVIGSFTTPLSKRLTFATSAAWAAGDMFLWTMPMPPSCARAMARRDSVTVSMAADSERDVQLDRAGEAGFEADFAGQDGRVGGNEQDVVERERLLDDAHSQNPSSQNEIIQTRPTPDNRAAPRRGPVRGFIDARVDFSIRYRKCLKLHVFGECPAGRFCGLLAAACAAPCRRRTRVRSGRPAAARAAER